MASKQIQCEMCCKENAVGYCETCGYVGESCIDIHKTGKVFQTHNVSMNEENNENPKVILRDITEERCKQHPTERAIFLCNVHDSMICGRCLHSEHLSCGKDVVDLLHEGVTIDCEKVKNMKSVLMEVKDEIQLVREDAEHSNDNNKKSADKCVMACMELGNQIKQRVDELTSGIRDEIRKKYDENLSTFSRITITCNETSTWCENEKRKIDEFVDNNMAGYLYLTCRKFEKGVSEVRSRLSEIKHKHTFKGFDFKENKVILKCVFEDLGEACKQEEVTESEDGSTNNVIVATTDIKKTRQELTVLLRQAIHFLDKSEKTRKALCDELKNVKQHLDNSEKARRAFEQELLKGKQGIEHSERARQKLCDELKQVKQELDSSEKVRR
ncbi:hypothetical protein MAR_035420 [Mya arenaria]|uniref:B box-type domain-containing protein n=1 Tax=Mya arenaria TaxID=6604 RepID=A0ABY7EMZ2_MYAAR|nr:hypothetical protein MAR_035420 [Mya arenaria]